MIANRCDIVSIKYVLISTHVNLRCKHYKILNIKYPVSCYMNQTLIPNYRFALYNTKHYFVIMDVISNLFNTNQLIKILD